MSDKKKFQDMLLEKEAQIIKETYLYCANNNISFEKEHNKLMRNAMRQFFKEGVYPLAHAIFHEGIRDYVKD